MSERETDDSTLGGDSAQSGRGRQEKERGRGEPVRGNPSPRGQDQAGK